MAILAEIERELAIERTRAGLVVAGQQGSRGSHKVKMTTSKFESARKLLAGDMSSRDMDCNLIFLIPTLYRWLRASLRGVVRVF
jgi:DNA invertase Pin-like site-specific DNA recombinase